MDPEMLTFYPGGIRVLLVDNDSKFLKTASMLLSLLNFKVSTCRSPRSALNTLSAGDKFKEVDVVLADANKVTTSGFDFKDIVEPELRVPVFYFLSQNHSCASAEADALLRTLDLASFILKKPFDVEDACSLWRDVAWRKCSLRSKTAATAGDVGQGRPPQWARSSDDDGEEKERVHFRIVRGGGKKRKDHPGNSSGSTPARRRGRPRKSQEQTMGVAVQETDCLAKPTPRKLLSKKARENGASASMPQIPEAMDVQPELTPQRKQSLFVQSVLQTLDVPQYNPSIFADAVEPGSKIISFSSARTSTNRSSSSSTSITAPVFSEPAPTPPPVYQAPPPPPPASPRVNQAPQAPAPAAAVYPPPPPALPVQQTPAGNIAPPAAATADKEDTLPQLLCGGAFGPFPYQGPRPAKQQDMFAPGTFDTSNSIQPLSFQQPPAATGDPFTGMAGGAATGGAAGATHAGGDYGNTASTLMQSLQLGASAQDEDDDVAGLLASYNAADPHLMVPQQQEVEDVATLFYSNNNAAMYNNSNNGESSVALHQGHGTAYGVNDPALAGGAFDGNAAAFTAPQGSGIVNNQLTTMGLDDLEAMFASDGNEGGYSFPLEYLMGTDLQMFDVGLGGQQGGEGTVGAADAFLNGGEGGMEDWAVGSAHDIPMLEGMLMNNTSGGDLFQYYMNIGPE